MKAMHPPLTVSNHDTVTAFLFGPVKSGVGFLKKIPGGKRFRMIGAGYSAADRHVNFPAFIAKDMIGTKDMDSLGRRHRIVEAGVGHQ